MLKNRSVRFASVHPLGTSRHGLKAGVGFYDISGFESGFQPSASTVLQLESAVDTIGNHIAVLGTNVLGEVRRVAGLLSTIIRHLKRTGAVSWETGE